MPQHLSTRRLSNIFWHSQRSTPNSRDHRGSTPLSHATRNGRGSIVQIFLKLPEIDTNTIDEYGISPFSWAVRRKEIDIFELFLRHWIIHCESAKAYCAVVKKETGNRRGVWEDIYSSERRRIPNLLSHCLLCLGDKESTLFASRQQVTIEDETLSEHHGSIRRNGCEMYSLSGKRFVCMKCIDIDLCTACMERHCNSSILEDCVNHEFLEVPCQKNSSEILETSSQAPQSLQELKLESLDQSQPASNPSSVVPTEWRREIEQRYRHWGFLQEHDLS